MSAALAALVFPPTAVFAWSNNGIGPIAMVLVVFFLLQVPLTVIIYISPLVSTEYGFLTWKINKCTLNAIKKSKNPFFFWLFRLDQISPFGLFRNDIYKNAIESQEPSSPTLFCINVTFAECLLREGEFSSAAGLLKNALSIEPQNLIANYLLAGCYERLGEIDNSIASYQVAHKTAESTMVELPSFIKRQIERIEKEGPLPKGAAPGLKFVIY